MYKNILLEIELAIQKKFKKDNIKTIDDLSLGRMTTFKLAFPDLFNKMLEVTKDIRNSDRPIEVLYVIRNNIVERQICIICKSKPVKFMQYNKGYSSWCSPACVSRDPKNTKKKIKTSIEKYGCESPNQSDSVKKKKEETSLINNGTKNPMQNKEIAKHCSDSNKEKHGGVHNFQIRNEDGIRQCDITRKNSLEELKSCLMN